MVHSLSTVARYLVDAAYGKMVGDERAAYFRKQCATIGRSACTRGAVHRFELGECEYSRSLRTPPPILNRSIGACEHEENEMCAM